MQATINILPFNSCETASPDCKTDCPELSLKRFGLEQDHTIRAK